ncbi:MAG: hypothetical protein GXP62_18090 [Oligoflexia bacterium]|nr:hypothetical protein [Oligoflexia bacterium]
MKAALDAGRAYLRRVRRADSSWGYTHGQAGQAEPTVLVAAAGDGPEWLARSWLAQASLGWAAFLLPAVAWERDPKLCERALDAIAAFHSTPVEGMEDFDATLPGWSWVAGTAAWVEPTAFAMLSLRRAGRLPDRVDQGVALLLDRQCSDGGWNYGNPAMFGTDLAGHLDATGWALLALPARTQTQDAIAHGLHFIAGALDRPSTLNLALASLACAAHQTDPSPFLTLLAPRLGENGARGRADLTALACAALATHLEGWHAFV